MSRKLSLNNQKQATGGFLSSSMLKQEQKQMMTESSEADKNSSLDKTNQNSSIVTMVNANIDEIANSRFSLQNKNQEHDQGVNLAAINDETGKTFNDDEYKVQMQVQTFQIENTSQSAQVVVETETLNTVNVKLKEGEEEKNQVDVIMQADEGQIGKHEKGLVETNGTGQQPSCSQEDYEKEDLDEQPSLPVLSANIAKGIVRSPTASGLVNDFTRHLIDSPSTLMPFGRRISADFIDLTSNKLSQKSQQQSRRFSQTLLSHSKQSLKFGQKIITNNDLTNPFINNEHNNDRPQIFSRKLQKQVKLDISTKPKQQITEANDYNTRASELTYDQLPNLKDTNVVKYNETLVTTPQKTMQMRGNKATQSTLFGTQINIKTPIYSGKKKINLEEGLTNLKDELTNNDASDASAAPSRFSKMLTQHRINHSRKNSGVELSFNTSDVPRKVSQDESSLNQLKSSTLKFTDSATNLQVQLNQNKSNSKSGSPQKEAVFLDPNLLDTPVKEPSQEIRIKEIHITKISQQVSIHSVQNETMYHARHAATPQPYHPQQQISSPIQPPQKTLRQPAQHQQQQMLQDQERQYHQTKYNPPQRLTNISKESTKDQDQIDEQSQMLNISMRRKKSTQGSVLKFNNEEQMIAYNDIEKLNEFTKHPVRLSRPLNSKHQKDHHKKTLSSQMSNSNIDGKQTSKSIYEQNSFTEGNISVGMNDKLLQFECPSKNNYSSTNMDTNAANSMEESYIQTRQIKMQNSAVNILQMNNASNTLSQTKQLRSGQLSRILRSKNSPEPASSSRGHQLSTYYNKRSSFANDGKSGSYGINQRKPQMTENSEDLRMGALEMDSKMNFLQASFTPLEMTYQQPRDSFQSGNIEGGNSEQNDDPRTIRGIMPRLSSIYRNASSISSPFTQEQGVPPLKQPQTPKTIQKHDVVDSFHISDPSQASIKLKLTDQTSTDSILQQRHQQLKEATSAKQLNQFALDALMTHQSSSSIQGDQQKRQNFKLGLANSNSGTNLHSKNYQSRMLQNQGVTSPKENVSRINKAKSPPIVKVSMQGYQDILGVKSVDIIDNNNKNNYNRRINNPDVRSPIATIAMSDKVQQKGIVVNRSRAGNYAMHRQPPYSNSGTINIFNEQVRKTNQFLVTKYEKQQKLLQQSRKSGTTREGKLKQKGQSSSKKEGPKRDSLDNSKQQLIRETNPAQSINGVAALSSQPFRVNTHTDENRPELLDQSNVEEPSDESRPAMSETSITFEPKPQDDDETQSRHEPADGGVFGKIFTRIGGIFASTQPSEGKQQTTNVDSQEEIEGDSSTVNLNSPGVKIDLSIANMSQQDVIDTPSVSVRTEEVVDTSIFMKPVRRYGRICDCPKDTNFSMFCVKARNWYEMTSTGSQSIQYDTEAKYLRLKETYKNLVEMPPDEDSLAQIERDLGRTFPRHPYFMSKVGGRGHQKLRRVLIAFSNYEQQVKYVQGMNFIVAQLLLHSTETFAFWLFVALIEDCEMRDIYEPELSGLFKHSFMIEVIIQANLPNLHARLTENHIRANVYASEWIFGLFSSVIPCDYMGDFFDLFFKHKWIFFYQLILSLLKKHEDQIINEEDFYYFMRQLKVQQYAKSGINYANAMLQSTDSEHRIERSVITSLATHDHKNILNSPDGLIHEDEDSLNMEETKKAIDSSNSSRTSMFGAFKKFLTDKVIGTDDDDKYNSLKVSDPEFWPEIIQRCGSEWPELNDQPGIPRLLSSFDSKTMAFTEQIPEDPDEIQAFLRASQ